MATRSKWVRVGFGACVSGAAVVLLSACGSSGSSSAGGQSSSMPITSAAMSSMAGSSTPMSSMAGSSAAGSSMAGSSAAAQPAAMIHIDKFKYAVPASVSPGAKVSVMNMDGEAHTVTADSGGGFDDKATAGAVTTFTAPSKPGSYPFHCTYHSNMHGVLVVK